MRSLRIDLAGAVIAFILSAGFSQASTLSDPVTVTGGMVRGDVLPQGGALFRGIPFAQPPLGGLRWKPPAPVVPWVGVRETVQSAPGCLQASYGWNEKIAATSREDCLYLDVRTPSLTPGTKLPVMVWIHGGANRAGSEDGYASSNITDHGVVLVTLQYRMDVLGFLSLPALTAESPHHASGNYGIMDQIAALTWVKENIARFGGDPQNVTIFGQSAGAQDVGLLQLSPQARGLFHRAIEQSGTAGMGVPPRSLAENEAMGRDFARYAGVAEDTDGLARLRALPGKDLLAASSKLVPPALVDASFIWLQAVYDGWVLPDSPAALLAATKQAPVPLLIGTDAQELPLYGGAEAISAAIHREFGPHEARARVLYGLDGAALATPDLRLGDRSMQLAADLTFRCPAYTVARASLKAGQPVWEYVFDRTIPGQSIPVSHGAELHFVFGGTSVGTPGAISPPTLQDYWTNFARVGDPNGSGLPVWPRFGDDRGFLVFTEDGPKPEKDLRGPICALLSRP